MDAAEGEETSLRSLTRRILTINFAAIHTSTMASRLFILTHAGSAYLPHFLQTFTHALFFLAAHPEYAKPMREEVQEIVDREGWTHGALNQMVKVDSFIRESQRLNPLGISTFRFAWQCCRPNLWAAG